VFIDERTQHATFAQELLNDPAIFKVVPAAPESPQIDDLGQSLRDFFLFMTALKG